MVRRIQRNLLLLVLTLVQRRRSKVLLLAVQEHGELPVREIGGGMVGHVWVVLCESAERRETLRRAGRGIAVARHEVGSLGVAGGGSGGGCVRDRSGCDGSGAVVLVGRGLGAVFIDINALHGGISPCAIPTWLPPIAFLPPSVTLRT